VLPVKELQHTLKDKSAAQDMVKPTTISALLLSLLLFRHRFWTQTVQTEDWLKETALQDRINSPSDFSTDLLGVSPRTVVKDLIATTKDRLRNNSYVEKAGRQDNNIKYRSNDPTTGNHPASSSFTWTLPEPILHPTRNHDSIILEDDDDGEEQVRLYNILGRHSRHIQVMDLLSGKQRAHHTLPNSTTAVDPDGLPVDNLNHVYAVVVDALHNENYQGKKKKEAWLTCGFNGDRVNSETSVNYARIVDLETLEVRVGPRLAFSGGACAASALSIIPNEPPMICNFGGTKDRHDSGQFFPYTACYDRVREHWWHPFGAMPLSLDHANVALIPSGICQADDPARIFVLNFRTRSYADQSGAILAFDLPSTGWTVEHLEQYGLTDDHGKWYVYHNETLRNETSYPRDAAGLVQANGGRNLVNFGGIMYYKAKNRTGRRANRFSMIRSFDICTKTWSIVGDLGRKSFALQTSASERLQVAVTCGGFLSNGKNYHNCDVTRLASSGENALKLMNRHETPVSFS